MGGKTSGQAVTEYAGIQVQTSSLGLQIPVGWGQFRCKCNLVWYGAFNAKAQKAASAGKGGSTTTGYSYTASIVLAICEGPIDSIATIYVDSKVYTNGPSLLDPNGSGTALSQANLNLATGEIGQAVWSYLTSNFPSQAIGYSGLAIAYQSNYALDSGASTPNHSFEVIRTTGYGPITTASGVDCDPSLVIADFFQNPRTGVPSWPGAAASLLDPVSLALYQDYCLAAGLLLSPLIDQERTASDFLTEMFLATNSTCVWSEGKLKFIPYGDTNLSGNGKTYVAPTTPVYDLDDDDFIVEKDAPPLQVDIEDQSDAYNVVQLEYLDRTNQYNMAIALASDAANVAQYGARRQDPTQIHVVCDPTIASLSAQLYLQRTLYIRAQYKFKLSWAFALLEPGDIIALTDSGLGLDQYTVRIIQIDQDEKYGLSFTCEDYPIGVAHSPLYQMQLGDGYQVNQNADPGGVEANLLLWSGDPTNAVWVKSACSITGAVADDQYGLETAAALVPATTDAAHYVYQGFSAFAGSSYTASVCLQQSAHYKARVYLCDAAFVDGAYLDVQLGTGEIITPLTSIGAGIGISGQVNATLVSGIWQIVITANVPSATTLYLVVAALSDTGAVSWTGDSSNAIYISQAAIRQGVAAGVYAQTTTTIAGPVLLNPPPALGAGSSMYAAIAGGPNWGGCNIWVSIDGTSYEQVGTQTVPARFGFLSSAFASHADPDTADTLSVDLGWSAGQLTGASSTTAVDNGATTSWIGPASELVSYESATLTNPCRYNLGTYIRRGFLNTPIAAHAEGALFVRMDNGIFEFPYLDINSGQTVYVKFQSFNAWGQALQSLADCVTYSTVPNPVAANAPGAGAWTCVAATLSSGGITIPVLEITGAVDNPSAESIHLYYRVTGAGAWTAGGTFPPSMTTAYITSLVSGDDYDAAISYVVGGVETALTQIGSSLAMPAVAGIAAGATRNVTTYSGTAPSSPANGDIWVDTADNPPITYLNVGGTWQAAANYVTGTSQIADTANLGQTAIWSSVSGTGKPANNATQNNVTYASSAPTGGQNGDIWVDTAASPPQLYVYDGGWQSSATFVNNTNQLTDGASLGETAVWGSVSGSGKPANNATENNVTYAASSPSGGQAGDIWVDTASTPAQLYVYASGGWQASSTFVNNTTQIYDGANLGGTAAWSGVSSKPANVAALGGSEAIQNAILQSALTAGSVIPAQSALITGQGALATLNQVGAAQIEAGAVGASQIASGAISSAPSAFSSSGYDISAGSPGPGATTTIQTLTLTAGAGPITLVYSTSASYTAGSTSPLLVLRLLRGTTLISETYGMAGAPASLSGVVIDTPGAGSVTYNLTAQSVGDGGYVAVSNIGISTSVLNAA